MAGAVANLMVRAGADFSQLQRSMQQAQEHASSFQNSMEKAFKGVETALLAVGIGVGIRELVDGVKEGVQSAMELEATTQNLSHLMGQSTDSFLEWSRTVAQSYGLSEVEADKYGKSFAHMISLFATNTDDLKNKTEEMLKTATIVANGTGRTMQDVMDRIQSGMLGNVQAINDLGIYANESMITSTKAFQMFANGKHWADLSMQTKQQIMYYAILEQANQQYGNTLNDNTHLAMVQFTAQLKNIQTALGEAFLPILNRVLPILTAMATRILQVMSIVDQFMEALFGKSAKQTSGAHAQSAAISSQAGAVNDLAAAHNNLAQAKGKSGSGSSTPKVGSGNHALKNGAGTVGGGKKLGNGFIASFDQVHTIAEKNTSGSGASGGGAGGAGGSGLGGLADTLNTAGQAPGILDKVSSKVREFADKVKAFFAPIGRVFMQVWDVVSSYFRGVVDGLVKFWQEHGAMFIQAMKNIWTVLKPIIMLIVGFIWDSIKGAIDGIIKFFEGLIEFISGIFTGHWKEAFQGLWDMVLGFVQAAWNIFNLTLFGGIKKLLLELVEKGAAAFLKLAEVFKKPLGDFVTWFVKAFMDMVKSIKQFFSDFGGWLENRGVDIAHAFLGFFDSIGNAGKAAWNVIKGAFTGAYDWFMRTLVNPVVTAFDKIKDGFSQGFTSGIKAMANSLIDVINKAIDDMNGVIHVIPLTGNISIPHIPHLAKGGITTGPTYALIGEAGPEAVAPLDKLNGMITNAVLTAMSFNNNSSRQPTGDIVLTIDGRTLARIAKPYLDNENKRVGTNVRLQSI